MLCCWPFLNALKGGAHPFPIGAQPLLSPLLAALSAFEVQPLPTEVHEGGVARFACKIPAHPPAIITWEVNGTVLLMETDR